MIKVRVLDFYLSIFDELFIQDKVNEALEAIDGIGYVKDIKINTTKERIIYTIIYEKIQMFPIV